MASNTMVIVGDGISIHPEQRAMQKKKRRRANNEKLVTELHTLIEMILVTARQQWVRTKTTTTSMKFCIRLSVASSKQNIRATHEHRRFEQFCWWFCCMIKPINTSKLHPANEPKSHRIMNCLIFYRDAMMFHIIQICHNRLYGFSL